MTRSRKLLWGLAIAVVGYVGFTSLPSGAEMLSGADSTRARSAELRGQIDRVDAALAEADRFASDLAAARAAVPVDAELSRMIALIDAAVSASDLDWASGAPSASPAEAGSGSAWSMSLTLNGEIGNVPVLLENLRRLPRLVVVDSVQVRGASPATVTLSLRFFAAAGSPGAFPTATDESVTVPDAAERSGGEG
jgi:Tfp pilus assembly protein PilO